MNDGEIRTNIFPTYYCSSLYINVQVNVNNLRYDNRVYKIYDCCAWFAKILFLLNFLWENKH